MDEPIADIEESPKVVAELRLRAEFRGRPPGSVRLRIGRPRPRPDGDWCCPLFMEGLGSWGRNPLIHGLDSWNALVLGLRFFQSVLTIEERRGTVFRLEGDERPIAVDLLFQARGLESIGGRETPPEGTTPDGHRQGGANVGS